MGRILVTGNGRQAEFYAAHLRKEGFRVIRAMEAHHSLDAIMMHVLECWVVVDLSPKALLKLVREAWQRLNARGFVQPPVLALTQYPFDEKITDPLPLFLHHRNINKLFLVAHIRALLRRTHGYPVHYRFGPLGLDPEQNRASLNGRPLALRPLEFNLLNLLIEAQGNPIPAPILANKLWPEAPYRRERLAVQLYHLRRQLGDRRGMVHIMKCGDKGYALKLRKWQPLTGTQYANSSAL